MSGLDYLLTGKSIVRSKFLYKFVDVPQSLMARFTIGY